MSDLISRQAAIDAMAELQGKAASKGELIGISKAWKKIKKLPSAQPTYTDEEIQKIQDLEQAQIEKAYQLGYEEGKKDAELERKTGRWLPHWCEDGNKDGDVCSCCKEWLVMPFGKFPYCPNCGAKMEG